VKARTTIRKQRRQAGIALLIAIFILLLISVVAIALIVSSGTESALAGNYRNATAVNYAALAGLEEARGRLAAKNSNSFAITAPGFLPPTGTPIANGHPIYIINPAGAEIVAPWDPASLYPDTQFNQEYGSSGFTLPNPSPSTPSLSTVAGVQGPLYKWVRINAVSEESLNLDVAPFDGILSHTKTVFYDGVALNDVLSGGQVLEITSFAVLPNGSQKILQYLVAPSNVNLSFPAAVTLDGPISTFAASFNSNFFVNGLDQVLGGNCPPAVAESPKPAIGAVGNGAVNQVINGIPPYAFSPNQYRYNHYISTAPQPTNPSVGDISGSLNSTFQTVNALDGGSQGLVQVISGLADQHVAGGATSLPDYGSAGPPARMVTTVVNGDLSLPSSTNGYGLLLVTGNLTLDGNASWNGVILVIGQGSLTIPAPGGGGEIIGAVLVAQTRFSDNSLRASLGHLTFQSSNPNYSNNGFYYNSCWVQAALPFGSYKILSFHEVSQ
jgi:hypothetical protein